jgi:hypothetical protein
VKASPYDEGKRPTGSKSAPWRFEVETPRKAPPTFGALEDELDRAWNQLQIIHTSFRAVEQAEYWTLVRRLQELDNLFLQHRELDNYYRDCLMPEKPENEPASLEDVRWTAEPNPETEKIISLQAQLLEDMFFVLRLDRYANAPDNRGWVNLARRWGRSLIFNERFDALRAMFSREFIAFYDLYLRYNPFTIDYSPIPHPWDREPGTVAASTRQRGPGVFLDSRRRDVMPDGGQRSGERPVPQPGSGGHGVAPETRGANPYDRRSLDEGESEGTTHGDLPNV